MNKKVLVTGAGGFIGSHLVELLLEKGYSVKALIHYNSSGSIGHLQYLDSAKLKRIEIEYGDVQDPQYCRHLLQNVKVVYHLAALISIPYSYKSPYSYFDTNVKGTLNLLEAAKEIELEAMVVTSSSEVYGRGTHFPLKESHLLGAKSPYAASKIAQEQLALSYYYTFQVPVIVARPFNTYGPRQSVRALIPSIISQLLHNPHQLKLGNLVPTRDWVYVKDTAEALRALAESGAAGEVYNVASGKEYSVRQVVETIASLMNVDYTLLTAQDRERPQSGEVMRLLGCSDKLRSATGWTPNHQWGAGISETISFLRRNKLVLDNSITQTYL